MIVCQQVCILWSSFWLIILAINSGASVAEVNRTGVKQARFRVVQPFFSVRQYAARS